MHQKVTVKADPTSSKEQLLGETPVKVLKGLGLLALWFVSIAVLITLAEAVTAFTTNITSPSGEVDTLALAQIIPRLAALMLGTGITWGVGVKIGLLPTFPSIDGGKWVRKILFYSVLILVVVWIAGKMFPQLDIIGRNTRGGGSVSTPTTTPTLKEMKIVQSNLAKLPYGLASVDALYNLRLTPGEVSEPISPASYQRITWGPAYKANRIQVLSNGVPMSASGFVDFKDDLNATYTFTSKSGMFDMWVALGTPPP